MLNDNLVTKATKINMLEEKVRQNNQLVNQVCGHNYRMVVNKNCDFIREKDALRSKYEQKLMEVEDQLSSETQKCSEVIKARIAPL